MYYLKIYDTKMVSSFTKFNLNFSVLAITQQQNLEAFELENINI